MLNLLIWTNKFQSPVVFSGIQSSDCRPNSCKFEGNGRNSAKKVTKTCVCQISRLLLYERKKETSQVGRILLDFCLLPTRLMLLKCRIRCVPEIALGCLGLLGKPRLWIETSGLNFSISIPNSGVSYWWKKFCPTWCKSKCHSISGLILNTIYWLVHHFFHQRYVIVNGEFYCEDEIQTL